VTGSDARLDRRVVLTLGVTSLLSACGHAIGGPSPRTSTSDTATSSASGSTRGEGIPVAPAPSGPLPTTTIRPAPASEHRCEVTGPRTVDGSVLQEHVTCSGQHAGEIALTIDDGPDPAYTPQILALLARLNIKATFCVVGMRAGKHPELVSAAADAGHQIANHTQTHTFLQRQPAARVKEEMGRATEAIVAATGHPPAIFRAPGGLWSRTVFAECRAQGLRPLGWSVDPRDWSRPGTISIVRTLLTKTTPGSIILDHDGGGDRSQTVQALTIALPRLLDAGYRFVQP
jgi:peptidoglycan/xylan/chitin deacetylase (PgdA/CDA1 family)